MLLFSRKIPPKGIYIFEYPVDPIPAPYRSARSVSHRGVHRLPIRNDHAEPHLYEIGSALQNSHSARSAHRPTPAPIPQPATKKATYAKLAMFFGIVPSRPSSPKSAPHHRFPSPPQSAKINSFIPIPAPTFSPRPASSCKEPEFDLSGRTGWSP